MQKKSFTLVELLIVILILWLIFSMSTGFINLQRQQKFVFGEQCVNHIFAEVDKFQSDVKYGKKEVSSFGGFPVHSTRMGINGSSWTTSKVLSYIDYRLINSNSNDELDIKESQFSHTAFGSAGSRPNLCMSEKYLVSFKSSTFSDGNIAFYTTPAGSFINSWNYNTIPSIITGDLLLSVCDTIRLGTIVDNFSDATNCVEIAKIYFDRRSSSTYFLKCSTIDTSNWTCKSRPRIN